MLLLRATFFSPIIAFFIAVGAVAFARMTNRSKPKVSTLVWISFLFAVAGAVASLILTFAWMGWYEKTTGYSAGNGPLGWIFFYGPSSAALGQLLALGVWWFRKPIGSDRDKA
jgi:hypothetical protein